MIQIRNMEKSDLHRVNMLLSKAFTQARFDDGYKNTSVPMCRNDFLEFYFDECGKGAFVLEDGRHIIGVSFCHTWGKTGWIGPLAILPDKHFLGYGKQLASYSIEYLKSNNCATIGLETNPRSQKNMGFYGKLGFHPSTLMLDLIKRVKPHDPDSIPHQHLLFSEQNEKNKDSFLKQIKKLTKLVCQNIDYSELIQKLGAHQFGDTVLFYRNKTTIGCAVFQAIPTTAEEKNKVLRLICFFIHPQTPRSYLNYFIQDLENITLKMNLEQVHFRVPAYCPDMLDILFENNFRVAFSDIRLVFEDYGEKVGKDIIFTNRWI